MAFFNTNINRLLVASGGVIAVALLLIANPAAAAEPGSLIITEFMANPAVVTDANGEWVEIKNPGDQTIDITGWDIDGSTINTTGEPLTIAPRTFAVICKNANIAQNDGVICDGTSNFSLGNVSDTISLRDEDNLVIASVVYGEGVAQNGRSTHASSLLPETTHKYSVNNFGKPAHNSLTPPEANGEIRVHHSIDQNRNNFPFDSAGEEHYKGRTIRLYNRFNSGWTYVSEVMTNGKYYAATAKFIVAPGKYAACEVSEPGYTQSYVRTILGWYNAPETGITNLSGEADEYEKCMPLSVQAKTVTGGVFGDMVTNPSL